MAQVVAKFPPRSVDNNSYGIPDFEPLLNSHQAAQLLDTIGCSRDGESTSWIK